MRKLVIVLRSKRYLLQKHKIVAKKLTEFEKECAMHNITFITLFSKN